MQKSGERKYFLLFGAIVISAGNFIAKIIGAIYRVPLTNLIGGEGIGLYQMIFPLYCALLDLSGAGIPSGLSTLISRENAESNFLEAKRLFSSSLRLMIILGSVCTVLMIALAYPLSVIQGDKNAYIGYLFLSPSLLFVSLISCYRGYFQGNFKMYPTALSNVVEQGVKAVFGIGLAVLLMPNVLLATGGVAFAITISEIAGLLLLVVLYVRYEKKDKSGVMQLKELRLSKDEHLQNYKKILRISLPVSLMSLTVPISQIVDSALIINILNGQVSNATSLYGIYSGAVSAIVNLPVSLCYGISVAIIPLLSKKSKDKNTKNALILTFAVSSVFAGLYVVFAEPIVTFLYPSLNAEELFYAINLLKIMSAVTVLLSLTQTLNSVFIALKRQTVPLVSLTFGVVVKLFLNVLLLPVKELGIYAAAISMVACYLVAVLFDLMYYIKEFSKKGKNRFSFRGIGFAYNKIKNRQSAS